MEEKNISEILEIVKEEEEDYLEVEIYKDRVFWVGLGIPTINLFIFLSTFIMLFNGFVNSDWVPVVFGLGSLCFLWPLSGIVMISYAKHIGNENMKKGALFSIRLLLLTIFLSVISVGIARY